MLRMACGMSSVGSGTKAHCAPNLVLFIFTGHVTSGSPAPVLRVFSHRCSLQLSSDSPTPGGGLSSAP